MKRFIILCLCMVSMAVVCAQDLIILRTAEKVFGVVVEVGPDYIKYRKSSNPEGPLFVLEQSKVASILYANGEVQAFQATPAAKTPILRPRQTNQGAIATPQTPAPVYNADSVAAVMAAEQQRRDSVRMAEMQRRDSIRMAEMQQRENARMAEQQRRDSVRQAEIVMREIARLAEQQRKDSIAAQKAAAKASHDARMGAIPRVHIGLLNYSYAGNKTHNVGLTLGWCHVAGVYVNVMAGLDGMHYFPSDRVDAALGNSYSGKWQLTNEHTHQRVSITPGMLFRLGCPLYMHVGLGYAYSPVTYQTTTGKWVGYGIYSEERHGLNAQFGLTANFRGFALSASYSGYGYGGYVAPWTSEILVGIGYAIDTKKGGRR